MISSRITLNKNILINFSNKASNVYNELRFKFTKKRQKEFYMKRFVLLAMLIMVVTTLTGCETMRGVGKDLNNLADGIKNMGD